MGRLLLLAFFISLQLALNDGQAVVGGEEEETYRTVWSDELKEHIMSTHNTFKNAQPGCELNKLSYDARMEPEIKGDVESCRYEPYIPSFNFGYSTKTSLPEEELIDEILTEWKGEKKRYNMSAKCCQKDVARNFVQMVWAPSAFVACFGKRCSNVTNLFNNVTVHDVYLFGCTYDPVGSVLNEYAIKRKKDCRFKCQMGQKPDEKFQNLCTGEPICEDKQEDCGDSNWVDQCSDPLMKTHMEMFCAKTCTFCTLPPRRRRAYRSTSGAGTLVGYYLAPMVFVLAGIAAPMVSDM